MSVLMRVEKKNIFFYPQINNPNNNNQFLKNIDYNLLGKKKQSIFARIVKFYVEGHTRRRKCFYDNVGYGKTIQRYQLGAGFSKF